jgi:hypothetical protein
MLRILTMIIIGFAAVIPYVAAEPGATYQPQDRQEETATQLQTKSVVGTIVAVDKMEKEITIRDAVTGETDTYKFNDATTFYKNDADIDIDGVVKGDKISLEVESDENLIVQLNSPSIVPIED